jgi:GTP cyclohydrolase I
MRIPLLKEANGNIARSEQERKDMIAEAAIHYGQFLKALGFDWSQDPNSESTPHRVAKAWVNDIARGSMIEKPSITQFPNGGYTGIVFQGNIKVVSLCSHHNLAFTGVAHLAYVPKKKGKVIGLSKLNRIVDWYSRRPQIQEGLTQQIADELNKLIDNDGIAVVLACNHSCCSNRGIGHDSTMQTAVMRGFFLKNQEGIKDEFYRMVAELKR